MQNDIAERILEKVKELPINKQKELLEPIEQRFVELPVADARPIWEVAKEISESIPLEEWEQLPSDGSVNHDHYLYGAPKKY